MDQRVMFVAQCLKGGCIADLCREFGISRKTAYKWIERYKREGVDGLNDRSRAPHYNPRAVTEACVEAILARRDMHREGPLKIRAALLRDHPDLACPCASTIGEILKAHGRIVKRRRTPKFPSTRLVTPMSTYGEPNAAWCVDFKGWFYTGNGSKCTPLTITDAWSRYLLGCFALGTKTGYAQVRPLMEKVFCEYGLPAAIRSDNGPPFGSSGLASLSPLAVWLIQVGIHPDHIRPAKPQDNGRHERFHLTLKQATASPPEVNRRRQQKVFDGFELYYNFDRPHQALQQQTPASVYQPSPREYPNKIHAPEYPREWTVRKVKHKGGFKWAAEEYHLSQSLAGHHVGFKPIDDGNWLVYFYRTALAVFDEPAGELRSLPKELK